MFDPGSGWSGPKRATPGDAVAGIKVDRSGKRLALLIAGTTRRTDTAPAA